MASVDQFHVAERVGRLLHLARNAFVPFATQTNRPVDGGSAADLGFPFFADFGKIVGPDEGRSAAVGAVDNNDVLRRQIHARIRFGDFRIVPFGDFTQEDPRQRVPGEVQLRRHAGQIVDRHIRAHHGGEMEDVRRVFGVEFLDLHVVHRPVGGAEIDRAFGHLLDAAARADRLIIKLQRGEFLVVIVKPLGIHGIREGCARPIDEGILRVDCTGHHDQAEHTQHCAFHCCLLNFDIFMLQIRY